MRFIHIADVHLGVSPDAGKAYSAKRSSEIWDTFRALLDVCQKDKIDLRLIAGDLFHRQPLLRELKEVNYLFSKLTRTKVVLIAGNHDYMKKDSHYRTFQWSENVYPLFQRKMKGVRFPEWKTAVYGFSYCEREIAEPRYDNAKAPRLERYEILLAHGGDEKHIPIRREQLMTLGYEYVALGHIHRPQEVLDHYARYAGSLEPTDRNDLGVHGYVYGEIGEKGVRTKFVPFAGRSYIPMTVQITPEMTSGELRDFLRKEIENRGIENIYKITLKGLRDPDISFAQTGEKADVFGNILECTDETEPSYQFEKLMEQNKSNLLGKYIASFQNPKQGSIEYEALCEGVRALLETKRG